ncbi:MAG TPA: HIT family protein [Nitrosopumilaceae archaeon]|nr:HIT family protein [Nitrosopumilaceae archaeon]
MTCLFCQILDGKIPAHFIYEDDSHVAIMDKYPIHRGHSLVIPRKHHEKITDMNVGEVSDLFSKVPSISRAVIEATGADGFNIGQNNGRAANQIIPHVHVHVIPRYTRIGVAWPKRSIADDKELEGLAAKIRKCMKSV